MKEITAERILRDIGYKQKLVNRIWINVIGSSIISIALSSILLIGSLGFVTLLFFLMLFIPTGFISLRNLLHTKKIICSNGAKVMRDTVTGRKKVGNRYLLMFKEYTARSEVGIRQTDQIYQKTEIGDTFLMVYTDDSKPLVIYPANEYYFQNVSTTNISSKKEITTSLMLKDAKLYREYIARVFAIFLGVGIPLLPVIQLGELNKNAIISILFLSVTFGLLFGVLFGLKPLISTLKMASYIKKGRINVVKDRVSGKRRQEHYDVNSCLVMFEQHSKKTGKGIFQQDKMYEQIKKGDEFYLVYVGNEKEPSFLYPATKYYYNR